ncbi:transcriptional regulator [Bradyrhizobium sp. 193]|nr:transcriptional regulator [Bradyrhizobium sp. 193]
MTDPATAVHVRLPQKYRSSTGRGTVAFDRTAGIGRIKLLEKVGVIRGYTAFAETGADSQGLAVLINITLEGQTVEYLNKFKAAVRMHPEIQECYLMIGGGSERLAQGVIPSPQARLDFRKRHIIERQAAPAEKRRR